MNHFAFKRDDECRQRMERTIASLLYFAIDKLNGKGRPGMTCAL